MQSDTFLYFGWILISISILCGLSAVYHIYQFKSYSRFRFVKLRKPTLTILYCCGAIFVLLLLTPAHLFLHLYDPSQFDLFWEWLLHFTQEFIVSSMLIILAARIWLLHYDHSYGVSLVDKSWKGAIESEMDFWLNNRKTWGDFGFIMCVSIVTAVTVLVALSSISIYTLQAEDLAPLHLISLVCVCLPFCVLLLFIMRSNRIKKLSVYDEFMIMKEIQYSSLTVVFVIAVFVFEITGQIDPYKLDILCQTGQILFCCLSTHIQTRWVVKQLIKQNRVLLQGKAILKAPKDQNTPNLQMSDILRTKDGFTMFMRHCQNELNVEGLLFIVEVAQYKAKLQAIMPQVDNKEMNEPHTHDDTSVSTFERRNSFTQSSVSGSNPHLTLTITSTTSAAQDMPRLPALGSLVSKKRETDTALDEFGSNILEREWIPISKQLFKPPKHRDLAQMSDELLIKYKDGSVSAEDMKYADDKKIEALQKEDRKMYEYAQHLFLKYIDVESGFTINVSYTARKEMLLFFSKDQEKGFEYILKKNGIGCMIASDGYDQWVRSLIIKQHLYGVFDQALGEIWKLLSSDTYIRFMRTKQYQYLIKNHAK